MADLVITANNVLRDAAADSPSHGMAGVIITAGQVVVTDPITKLLVLCDADHATPALRKPDGIALNSAQIGQPVAVHKKGKINPGAAVVLGTIYVVSGAAGGICPAADISAGEEVSILGVASSVSQIQVEIVKTGIVA